MALEKNKKQMNSLQSDEFIKLAAYTLEMMSPEGK